MTTLVIILAIAVTVAVVAWFIFQRQNPEQSASHSPPDTITTSEQLYEGADRPARPLVGLLDPDRLVGDHRPPT